MLLPITLVIVGLAVLVFGGELLVKGASSLALRLGLSPLVVGLIIVAYGTSTPEFFVSVSSSFSNLPDVAVGTVVGSNILNILLILGLSAVVIPLTVQRQLVRFDLPVLLAATFAFLITALDGQISRVEGAILVVALITYSAVLITKSRKESKANPAKEPTDPPMPLIKAILLMFAGLAALAGGSRIAVIGAVDIARSLGLSELVIGLTIVAFGTSLPELVTSIIAAIRKERDLAVGNIIGSNIFNNLCVAGFSSLILPIPISSHAFAFDVPIMIATTLTLIPILWVGYYITRAEGILLVGGYIAYTTYLILDQTKHPSKHLFQDALLYFALPLAVITLLTTSIFLIRRGKNLPQITSD